MFFKYLPLANFTVSMSAFTFQVFVLYPWHEKLSLEFEETKKEIKRLKLIK